MGVGGVGAVGGAIAGAGGVSAPSAGVSGVGDAGSAGAVGVTGAAGSAGANSLTGIQQAFSSASPQQMQQLMSLLKDFTSADLLLAFMMANATDSKDRTHNEGSALLGLLAGMALAGQIGSMSNLANSSASPVGGSSAAGGTGMNLNTQA